MDWFRSCQSLVQGAPVFITDNYGREGFVPLLKTSDDVRALFVIDPLLPNRSSRLGNLWRNLLKLLLVPLQVWLLRKQLRRLHNPFVFAHLTYYAFVASFAGARYAATPQGSEVLVRPRRSFWYKLFLRRAMRKAVFVTVDSRAMASELEQLCGVSPHVVQNGIDLRQILATPASSSRTLVTSIRGIDPLYRITEILRARTRCAPTVALNFCAPFQEATYLREVERSLGPHDRMHGRLPRERLYSLLKESLCVISIPISDSSPRSVYEAVFCGAAVICTPSAYLNDLPHCMRQRIIAVDLEESDWFATALESAEQIAAAPYEPSAEAIEAFDQRASMARCLRFALEP